MASIPRVPASPAGPSAAGGWLALWLTDLIAPGLLFLVGMSILREGAPKFSTDRRSADESWLSLAAVYRGLGRSAALMCAALAACTAPNPRYQPGVLVDGAGSNPADTAGQTGDVPGRDLASGAPRDSRSDLADSRGGPMPSPRYSFESSTQGWQDQHGSYFGQADNAVSRARSPTFDGAYSLAIELRTTGMFRTEVGVTQSLSGLRAGTVITYHIWFPNDGTIEGVQPYVFYFHDDVSAPVFAGTMPILYPASLNPGGWTTVTHRVPSDVDGRGVTEVGFEWRTNGPQIVTVFMDAITW
jgi:hypothetical protein